MVVVGEGRESQEREAWDWSVWTLRMSFALPDMRCSHLV